MTSASSIIEVDHVSNRFGGTQALSHVSLELKRGEVHALVGERARVSPHSARSSPACTPSTRELSRSTVRVERWDPVRAQHQGIVMIAQELSPVPDLTVEQKVFLGIKATRFGILRRNVRQRFDELERAAHVGAGSIFIPVSTLVDLATVMRFARTRATFARRVFAADRNAGTPQLSEVCAVRTRVIERQRSYSYLAGSRRRMPPQFRSRGRAPANLR